MSTHINQQLKATGVAQVIVVLKTAAAASGALAAAKGRAAAVGAVAPPPATAGLAGLEGHFQQSELSQASALAEVGLTRASLAAASAATRRRAVQAPPDERKWTIGRSRSGAELSSALVIG